MTKRAYENGQGTGSPLGVGVGDTEGTVNVGRARVRVARPPIAPRWQGIEAGLLLLAATVGFGWSRAADIPVPNGSFESPVTEFADPRIDAWQETPKPDWYDESGGYLWDQLTGTFKNTDPGSADRIENCDGHQAVFLFAVPQVGLFQDYDSTDWSNATPTHAFDVKFEVGKAYQLTVGVVGGGGNMQPGTSLLLGLYYRDGAGNPVTVGATSAVHSAVLFPTMTNLVDFQVEVPAVRPGDAWAGKHIGIQLLSTVDFALMGGYWDLDHVRLTSVDQPVLLAPGFADGRFGFTLQSAPGLKFDVLAATDPSLPLSGWTSVATLTNVSGAITFRDETPPVARRFYRARQIE